MLVTVIVTTYKRPTLLTRALRSVLSQKIEGAEIELIVSDDDIAGSGLAAINELKATTHQDCAPVYIKLTDTNSGVAASRNRALNACKGEWVIFLDDDDQLLEGAISSLLKLAEEQNADFCAGNYLNIEEDGKLRQIKKTPVTLQWRDADQLLLNNQFPIGCFVIRKAIIRNPFYTQIKTHEDWLFLIDNLVTPEPRPRVAISENTVLAVHQATDDSRVHRNREGGWEKIANDYARIYSLHPAPHLVEQRQNMLAWLSPRFHVTLDMLIGNDTHVDEPFTINTSQGIFLICNPHETIQTSLIREGKFEPVSSQIAIAMAKIQPGVIIDVGANQGIFSVPVARALPRCSLICAEPQTMVFMQLCSNLVLNKAIQASPKQIAVGRPGVLGDTIEAPRFDIFKERFTGSVTLDDDVANIRGEIPDVAEPKLWATHHDEVPVISLDSLANDEQVAFIKVDVEGMELEVLKSGESLLCTQKPPLFFEAWSLVEFQAQRQALLQYVAGLGYQTIKIGEDFFAYHPQRMNYESVISALRSAGLRSAPNKQ